MLLHRHASAGERVDDAALDDARPLDSLGRADARRLPGVLAGLEITQLVSSPLRRCVESVRPLAEALGLELELSEELTPGAPLAATNELLGALKETTLVCTHREVIERLFGGAIACEKGGTWLLEREGSKLVPVEYLPPPSTVERERRLASLTRSR
jgi:phosphohistidine phosphatase SixA